MSLRIVQPDDGQCKMGWIDLMKAIWFILGEKRRKKYLLLTFLLFVVQAYWLVPPLILGRVVDFFANHQKGESLATFYLYAMTLGLLHVTAALLRLTVKKKLGNMRTDIVYDIRVKGFEKLIAHSISEGGDENAGAKAQKIQNGTEVFSSFAKMFENQVFISLTSLLGATVLFTSLRPPYVAILAIYVTLFTLIIRYFYRKIQALNYDLFKSLESASGSYVEGLSNILTIKALGAESSFKDYISDKEETRRGFEYRIRQTGNDQWKTFNTLNGFFNMFFLLLLGHDVIAGTISIGSVVVFYGYFDRITASSADFMLVYEDLIRAKTSISRMMEIFLARAGFLSGSEDFPVNWKKIEIKNGSYLYSDRSKQEDQAGLIDVNIMIKKNQKIGIVGKTGSGKSTLAKVLVGLYPLASGQYLIGGRDFYGLDRDQVLEKISVVLQDSEMFNMPLRENITLMRDVDPAHLNKAIEIAQLKGLVAKLSNGLDTLIGEKGYRLSGGERQRVGIARAICRDSEIIVFDEATSSLDTRTEKLIQAALTSELRKKTLIFVAHRVSTLKDVDLIYVFKDGAICEKGTYEELSQDPGSLFSKIYGEQGKRSSPLIIR